MKVRTQLSWIENHIHPDGIRAINNIFPDHFAAYFKIHLPYAICKTFPADDYIEEPDTIENMNRRLAIGRDFFEEGQWEKIKANLLESISFREIAQRLSLEYDVTFSQRKIIRQLGKRPIHLQRHLPYELDFIKTLVQMIGSQQKSHFYINGNHQFEQINKNYSKEWMATASLDYLVDLYQELNNKSNLPFPLLPSYVFGDRKDWCLASGKIMGSHYLLLATNQTLANALVQEKNWAIIPLKYSEKYG